MRRAVFTIASLALIQPITGATLAQMKNALALAGLGIGVWLSAGLYLAKSFIIHIICSSSWSPIRTVVWLSCRIIPCTRSQKNENALVWLKAAARARFLVL